MRIPTDSTARDLQTLFGSGTTVGLTDGQLLERFSTQPGDSAESAFAALVDRHGPMVLRACRAVLRDEHDARDAFQATFLILARKGPSLWLRDSLAPWLYRVARRAALRLASQSGRRRDAERRAAIAPDSSSHDDLNRDTERILHEEVDRLPERFRRAIILCDLDGRTHDEAARSLGCPIGTIKSRLARGRDRLRAQLTRRGLAPAVGLPGWLRASPELSSSTIRLVIDSTTGGRVAAVGGAAALARATMRGTLMDPIKMAAAFVLGLGVSGAGYGLLARAAADPAPPPKPAAIVAADAPPAPAPTPPKAADPPASGDEAKEARRRVFAMGGPTQAWAYDAKNRKWRVYKAPDSSSLTVSSGKSIATAHSHAFMGSKFTELAAFSADTGEWSRQALIEPYDGSMILASIAIDDDHAYYNVGEFLYVFTSRDGRWHHARLTAKPEDGPRTDFGMPENLKVGGKCVMYLDKVRRRLSAFSIATETWDFLDLDRVSPQGDVRTSPDGLVYVMNGDRLFAYEPKLGKFREVRPDEG